MIITYQFTFEDKAFTNNLPDPFGMVQEIKDYLLSIIDKDAKGIHFLHKALNTIANEKSTPSQCIASFINNNEIDHKMLKE